MLLSSASSVLFNSSNQPAHTHLFHYRKKACIHYRQDTLGDRRLQYLVQQLDFFV